MEGVFSERILRARKERNLSQRAAAALIGIQPASLSSYESGRNSPNLEIASKIASAYGCSLDWLCGLMPEKTQGMNTRADVFRHLTALCESGIPVSISLSKAMPEEFMPSYPGVMFGDTDVLSIKLAGDWVLEFGAKYERLLRLYLEKDIDSEVLEAWKKTRIDANEDVAVIDGEEAEDILW